MAVSNANWNYPTAIRFGAGRLSELRDACLSAGIKRPLLVTDSGLADLPMVRRAAGVATGLFSNIRGNPTQANIADGLAAYAAGAHDGVIALGGGSALDAGKVIALMSGQVRPMWDFEDKEDWWTRANPDGIAPVVAIPTTAGTGSEVGRAGVILDEERHEKKIIFHPAMLPKVVILDPELTVGLPPHLTAATGMDALSHCLEAWFALGFHPMADGIAAEGARLIHDWLPRAFRTGGDIEARGHMQVAAAMGATAFQKGLGGMHALSHPIGALCDTHHGLTNAVLMPYVLAFNRPAIEDRAGRLAATIGLAQPSFTALLDWVLQLREELGIPATLADLKVSRDHIEALAKMAEADPSAGGNPVPFDEAAARQVLQSAFDSRL